MSYLWIGAGGRKAEARSGNRRVLRQAILTMIEVWRRGAEVNLEAEAGEVHQPISTSIRTLLDALRHTMHGMDNMQHDRKGSVCLGLETAERSR